MRRHRPLKNSKTGNRRTCPFTSDGSILRTAPTEIILSIHPGCRAATGVPFAERSGRSLYAAGSRSQGRDDLRSSRDFGFDTGVELRRTSKLIPGPTSLQWRGNVEVSTGDEGRMSFMLGTFTPPAWRKPRARSLAGLGSAPPLERSSPLRKEFVPNRGTFSTSIEL